MDPFMDMLEQFDNVFWLVPFVLISGLGIYATIKFKGIQFTHLKEMFKITFSREKRGHDAVTSFQVFCLSMGNRVGIGNIAGPVTAIISGGPGAIFWMWIFAALGGATCFIESTIGQLFKSRDKDGGFEGGPAFNVSKGLNMKKFGMVIALLMILMYLVGYISSEVSAISEAFCEAFVFDNNATILAIVMILLMAAITLGGFRRVAKASSFIVPFMAIAWIIMCIIVILVNFQNVGNAFLMIFKFAFNPPAFAGGLFGALLWGMRRGIWSNEAGIGTITNVSSKADVRHPVTQGLSQSLGVFFDTIMCTITALVVLSFSGFNPDVKITQDSIPYLQNIFSSVFGNTASVLVFFFIFLFALTCLMGDYVIGENNMKFITGSKSSRWIIMVLTIAVVFISCFFASDAVFVILDILLAVLGIINVFVIFRLSGRAIEAYRDYRRQKDSGVAEPEFHKDALSDDTGITEWE